MLKIWGQFFTGFYIADKSNKKDRDKVDNEDGPEADYEIIPIGDGGLKEDDPHYETYERYQ